MGWGGVGSAKIRPRFLANRYAASLIISENSDLRTISQILEANVLLLNHSRRIAHGVMYPYVRMTSFIIVIKQALHSWSTAAVATSTSSRHMGLVYALAFQSLWTPCFQCVHLFQYWSYPHLKLHRPVTQVPHPCAEPGRLSMIPATIKAPSEGENPQPQTSHFQNFCSPLGNYVHSCYTRLFIVSIFRSYINGCDFYFVTLPKVGLIIFFKSNTERVHHRMYSLP